MSFNPQTFNKAKQYRGTGSSSEIEADMAAIGGWNARRTFVTSIVKWSAIAITVGLTIATIYAFKTYNSSDDIVPWFLAAGLSYIGGLVAYLVVAGNSIDLARRDYACDLLRSLPVAEGSSLRLSLDFDYDPDALEPDPWVVLEADLSGGTHVRYARTTRYDVRVSVSRYRHLKVVNIESATSVFLDELTCEGPGAAQLGANIEQLQLPGSARVANVEREQGRLHVQIAGANDVDPGALTTIEPGIAASYASRLGEAVKGRAAHAP